MNLCIAVPGLTAAQRSRLQAALAAYTLTFCAEFPEFEKRAAVATAHVIFGNVPAAWLSAGPCRRGHVLTLDRRRNLRGVCKSSTENGVKRCTLRFA